MRRCVTLQVVGIVLLSALPLVAQTKAKAENVPEIYKVQLDGTPVGKFGRAGKELKQFGLVNSIDWRRENELLVGELSNWRVQKLTLKPASAPASARPESPASFGMASAQAPASDGEPSPKR